jgi:hypothetical protein
MPHEDNWVLFFFANDKENAINTCQSQDRLEQLEASVGLHKCEHSGKLQQTEISTDGMGCKARLSWSPYTSGW